MALDNGKLEELRLSGALPSPSGVGLAILELTRREDYCLNDLTARIQADPALTGRILKLANGSTVAGAHPVTNVSEAVMRLGVNAVRNLVLGFSLITNNRSGSCEAFEYDEYWSGSLVVALCAQEFAEQFKVPSPADAFTCGLLSGIGRLALASIHPQRYVQVIEAARGQSSAQMLVIERQLLDVDHNELGAALVEDWRLPMAFSFAVATHENRGQSEYPSDPAGLQLALLLNASTRVADLFMRAATADESTWRSELLMLEELRESVGLEVVAFSHALDRVAKMWTDWGAMLSLPTHSIPPIAVLFGHETESDASSDTGSSREARSELSAETPPPVEGHPAPQEPSVEVATEADAASADTNSELAAEQSSDRRGLRILAVDDDPVSLRILVQHLARDGHTVTQARNGREALEASMSGQPQLIVTDWMMPEMDGIEFCKALRLTPTGRGIYVLILTAREDEERIVEAFDAGADDYVVKPFNARILLARVRAGQRMIELREQVELDRRERARQLAEMAVLNRKLRAAALTDVLTELPNRRYAIKRLEQELARSQRSPAMLSVMMLDIDYFKSVNDEHGHDVGDHVLRETAAVLRRMTRRGDVVCRLGGEEFLIVCSNCEIEEARQSAERIRAAVAENQIQMGDETKSITISIGVAELEGDIDNVDELLKRSDRRVYQAKHSGRNRVVASDLENTSEPGSERRSA